jgi:glucose/arabinose dehydrogenase
MMIRQAPTRHWYEAYRNGDIYVLSPDGTRTSSPILSIPTSTDSEMGMWGLALHPNFSSDPFIYLYYSDLGGPDNTGRGIVARYRVDSPTTSPSIDPSSREEIFVYERGNTAQYHWGGTIEFHPTSAGAQLYLATGNAGVFDQTACDFADPPDSANGVCPEQYLATYLGKLIRFDVTDTSDGATYTPEIVGLGLRNPFRWSFDTGTGDLWIGDVGDSAWEELTYVPNAMIPGPGEEALNFGFPCFEGFEAYMGGSLCDALTETVEPIHAYGRDVGVSIIGGRVYRGSNIAGIAGTYFFNDYFPQTGFIPWILRGNPSDDPTDPTDAYQREELEGWAFYGYTEDIDGELYGLHQGLWRLEATGDPAAEETMASSLSGTGCFDGSGNPTGGMIPFEVRAPLWSDGASKRRWLSIPDGTNITLDADGDFVFPNGTILAKEFTQNGVRVETRLLVRHPDGAWEGYTYAWMDEGGNLLDDAELISSDSSTRTIPGSSEDWVYPSRGQCETCHTQAAGFALGPEVAQLNYPYTYPDGESTNSQIHTLSAIGILESPVDSYRESMRLASYDEETSEERLAQAYLHSNCGGCHREGAPGFGGRSTMPDIVYRPGASNSSLTQLFCGVGWGTEHLGLGEDAQLVQPGVPGTWDNLDDGGSLLYLRTGARDNVPGSSGAMPPLGSRLVDEEGMRLLSDWITQLDCP